MSSRTGSRSWRASSGSRSATYSVDPFMSAQRIVICFRSPSRVVVDLSIRLARLLEALEGRVSDRLEAACPTLGEVRDAPQLSQNLLSAVKELPQTGQSVPNVAPHSRQNRASWRLIWPHRGHCMPISP